MRSLAGSALVMADDLECPRLAPSWSIVTRVPIATVSPSGAGATCALVS